jgi:hypothetical protein
MTLLLAGCATLMAPPIAQVAQCQANYLALDQRVAAASARHGGADAIAGFPYLRADRFLASFRHEVRDGPAFDAWVGHLRRLDLAARASELRNLGWDDPSEELRHLDRCGAEWAARDLADPRRRALLRENAAVPDDYSILQRMFGAYAAAVPFLNLGISGFNRDVLKDYATPLAELKADGELVLWSPATAATAARPGPEAFGTMDSLGIPLLTDAQWQALARAHAPHWLVETAGDFDLLGAPVLRDGKPAFDAARPVTHFLPAYTRFGGEVRVQLVYVAWFAERPVTDVFDPYGGTLDGVVWRVTLDRDGAPLLYDTIHACGCYHYYYPVRPLQRRRRGGYWEEPVLFPQDVPAQPFAIRLQSGTHYVRRLVPLAGLAAARVALYEQVPYDELLSLPDGARRRSLFGEDGIADGTERGERWFLWPAGVRSPGAMRQWGRHATSFVGRSHFDDPGLLDRLFHK